MVCVPFIPTKNIHPEKKLITYQFNAFAWLRVPKAFMSWHQKNDKK